jgi:hypothetical protein
MSEFWFVTPLKWRLDTCRIKRYHPFRRSKGQAGSCSSLVRKWRYISSGWSHFCCWCKSRERNLLKSYSSTFKRKNSHFSHPSNQLSFWMRSCSDFGTWRNQVSRLSQKFNERTKGIVFDWKQKKLKWRWRRTKTERRNWVGKAKCSDWNDKKEKGRSSKRKWKIRDRNRENKHNKQIRKCSGDLCNLQSLHPV